MGDDVQPMLFDGVEYDDYITIEKARAPIVPLEANDFADEKIPAAEYEGMNGVTE